MASHHFGYTLLVRHKSVNPVHTQGNGTILYKGVVTGRLGLREVILLLWFSLTLCNPMGCSTPGVPVLHYLLEFAQNHIQEVILEAAQNSPEERKWSVYIHPFLSSSPPPVKNSNTYPVKCLKDEMKEELASAEHILDHIQWWVLSEEAYTLRLYLIYPWATVTHDRPVELCGWIKPHGKLMWLPPPPHTIIKGHGRGQPYTVERKPQQINETQGWWVSSEDRPLSVLMF